VPIIDPAVGVALRRGVNVIPYLFEQDRYSEGKESTEPHEENRSIGLRQIIEPSFLCLGIGQAVFHTFYYPVRPLAEDKNRDYA